MKQIPPLLLFTLNSLEPHLFLRVSQFPTASRYLNPCLNVPLYPFVLRFGFTCFTVPLFACTVTVFSCAPFRLFTWISIDLYVCFSCISVYQCLKAYCVSACSCFINTRMRVHLCIVVPFTCSSFLSSSVSQCLCSFLPPFYTRTSVFFYLSLDLFSCTFAYPYLSLPA